MRISVLVALMLVTTAAMAPRPAAAFPDSPSNNPWCATYYDASLGMKQCTFATFEQCLATVSGVGGQCAQNPFYAPPLPPYAERRHHRAKHVAHDR